MRSSKIVVQLNDANQTTVAMELGSSSAAAEWVNDIVTAQVAALRENPTIYSGSLRSLGRWKRPLFRPVCCRAPCFL